MRTLLLVPALVLVGFLATPHDASAAPGQIQITPGDMPFQMLPPGRQAKTGTGRLRGRVAAADTGSVVRRAQVRISSPDIGTKTALTDAQGRYEFKDLPAGRFNVSVSKSGFVTMQYGQTRPFETGRPIDLVEAQVLEKVDIALPRGSAVSGRILDEFGEPVADASVTAMRMQYTGGKRRLAPAGRNSTTNDLGQFRVFGLPPGEYYVSATLRTIDSMVMDMLGGSGVGGPSGSNNSSGYAATYYPGTPNPGEAQRLSLAVGQEVSSVDIQMQPVRLARITGSAVGSDGKPMSGAMVMLMPTMKEAIALMPGGTSRTDKDGNFTLTGVAPGEYSLQVQSLAALMNAASQAMSLVGGGDAAPSTPPQPMEREFATANLTVAGEDITGMIVTGTRGAKATGKIVFENGQKPEAIASLRLIAGPTDTDTMPAAASVFGMTSVKDTGAFEIDGLVGGRVFRLANPPKGWFLKRVTHDGEDITDKGYTFKPGEDVDDFEIALTTRSQTVTGSVTNDKGEPLKEYTVVVFPEDTQKWTLTGSRWRSSARPDQQGQFKIADLPPGDYLAIAVEYVGEGEWTDPEWLARAVKNATKFTLAEGGTKTLDLKRAGS
jgi:Carboxypeptidase regulatory-like domain